MFWHVSVCPQGGGTLVRSSQWGGPIQPWTGGVPHLARGYPSQVQLGGGGYPSQVWWGSTPARSDWGYPSQVQMGREVPQPSVMGEYLRWGPPYRGYPPARSDGGTWGGVPPSWEGVPPLPPIQDSRWSTWYAAVGMPFAFTQEDFVLRKLYWTLLQIMRGIQEVTTFIRIMSALLDVNLLREDVEKKGVIYCVQCRQS